MEGTKIGSYCFLPFYPSSRGGTYEATGSSTSVRKPQFQLGNVGNPQCMEREARNSKEFCVLTSKKQTILKIGKVKKMNKRRFFSFVLALILFLGITGVFNVQHAQASVQPKTAHLLNADQWYTDGGGECDDDGDTSLSVIISNMFGGNSGGGEDDPCEDDGNSNSNSNSNSNANGNGNENDPTPIPTTPTVHIFETPTSTLPAPTMTLPAPTVPATATSTQIGTATAQVSETPAPTASPTLASSTSVANDSDNEVVGPAIQRVTKSKILIPVTGAEKCDNCCCTRTVILTWDAAGDEQEIRDRVEKLVELGYCFSINLDPPASVEWSDDAFEIILELMAP